MTVINMKISVKQVFIKIDQLSQINKNKLICYEIKGRLLAEGILHEKNEDINRVFRKEQLQE